LHYEAYCNYLMVPGTGIEPVRWFYPSDGFSSHYGFRRQPAAVRALDYAFTIAQCAEGAPRLVSTPSHKGLARRCLDDHVRGFSEFEGIHMGAFATQCSIYKSVVSTNFTTRARVCILHED
jgi:hypothetical protein